MIDFFFQLVHTPQAHPWLFIGACLGHAFLFVITLNLIYGLPLHHQFLDNLRKVDIIIVLGGPLYFAWQFGWVGPPKSLPDADRGLSFADLYLLFCAFLGLVIAPIAQVRYWLRPRAPQVLQKSSTLLNVPEKLGYLPVGTGKHERLARMPGNSAFEIEYVDLHLHLPQIPAVWEGLTILHLTDLHFIGCPDRKFHRLALEHALNQGIPDLVCITGDIIDSPWHHRWIIPLLGNLRWKDAGLAILGNHDKKYNHLAARRRLQRVGFQVLGDTWKNLSIRDHPLTAIGHEGPWFRPAPDLAGVPQGIFRLLLSHTPDNIGWAQKHAIDLMLAGHVHGGHIRLPLIGSTLVPSRFSRKYDCGTFFEYPTVLHVSRGISGQHPFRLNCRPEITRVILHRERKDG